MANGNDGNNLKDKIEKIKTYGEDGVAMFGNADAKKLASAFKELSKDGLAEEEMQKLKQLDKELKGAEYHCLSSDVTLVTQHENHVETNFVVAGNNLKQNTVFVRGKAGK